mmetsp:Transcript_53815/g.158395  ORF Transcript_53815/g.158395 Transcript_53815/m.158395 type:complete len:578 (+) Transcript_53815:740-2473(+)
MEALPVVGRVELPAQRGLQEEVERLRAAVGLVQLDDELGVRHHEDALLVHGGLLHAHLHDEALAQGLERVGLVGLPVLPELHGAEAAAAEEPHLLQVLLQDLLPPSGAKAGAPVGQRAAVAPGGRRPPREHAAAGGLARPALVDDLLQWPEEEVEEVAVHHQDLGHLRGHPHGGAARLAPQQGALAEELREPLRLARLESRLGLPVLQDLDLALVHDVEGVAHAPLLQDHLVLGVVHLHEGLRHGCLLLGEQGVEDLHVAQVLHVLVALRGGHLHEDVLEVLTVDDPDHRPRHRLHGGGARHEVEQGQLPEAAPRRHRGDGRRVAPATEGPLRALPGLLGDEDLEAPLLDDVEVVRDEVPLRDELRALLHVLLPRDVDHLLHARLVEGQDRLEVQVPAQGLREEFPLARRLGRGRPGPTGLLHGPPADRLAVGELQPLVQPQLLELLPRDPQRDEARVGLDRGRAGLVAEQGVLAEVVAGPERGHPHGLPGALLDAHAGLPGLDHEELVAQVALPDHGLAGLELLLLARGGQEGMLVPGEALQERHPGQELHVLLVGQVLLLGGPLVLLPVRHATNC